MMKRIQQAITSSFSGVIDLTVEECSSIGKRKLEEPTIDKKKEKKRCTKTIQSFKCSICQDIAPTKSKPVAVLKCNHSFCLDCIQEWVDYSSKCPLCRNFIVKCTFVKTEMTPDKEGMECKTCDEKEDFLLPRFNHSKPLYEPDVSDDYLLALELQYESVQELIINHQI